MFVIEPELKARIVETHAAEGRDAALVVLREAFPEVQPQILVSVLETMMAWQKPATATPEAPPV